MLRKTTQTGHVKLLSGPGEFECCFATLGVVDHDGDWIARRAFKRQAVRIASWGHDWGALPVGRGAIREEGDEALCRGAFFLDTEGGRETYATLKGLDDLAQFSFGFDILDSGPGKVDGQPVRILRKLEVYEVSPVLLGAGINTRLTAIAKARTGGMTPLAVRATIGVLERDLVSSPAGALPEVLAAIADLEKMSIGSPAEAMDEIVRLADPAMVKSLAPTNRDRLRQAIIGLWGPDHSPLWIEAMVDGELARLVEADYQRQELSAGVVPSRAVAMAEVARWAASPV